MVTAREYEAGCGSLLKRFDCLRRSERFDCGRITPENMPIITGQDCDKPNVKNIVAGYQDMSVFKDTRTLASQVVKMVDAVMQGSSLRSTTQKHMITVLASSHPISAIPVVCTVDNLQKNCYRQRLLHRSGRGLKLV